MLNATISQQSMVVGLFLSDVEMHVFSALNVLPWNIDLEEMSHSIFQTNCGCKLLIWATNY